ncbi:D-arabinono-1,4-lactone oxidase [Dispira parvispora]|uniref:D-arabinono-1,4-lactone oxidase n=1 Tax=Dispira parvispora TaxID=1520584 RepID=A0A9W8E3D9_9FUNG|nr:D-arabinono-1,4-lactone oxidase [Dispira parvispora]
MGSANKQSSHSDFVYSNWAKTFTCRPEVYHEPKTEEDIVGIIRQARQEKRTVKVFGAGHSPSDLPCCEGYMLNMDKMNRVLEVDTEMCTITVEAGMRLQELNAVLHKHGMALSVLGAISEQSIAGAIATATHGTGTQFNTLSSMVQWIRLINGKGEIMECSSTLQPELFAAARCHLGALGIITQVTLQCEKAFRLESQQRPVAYEDMVNHFDELVESAEHVKFLWFPYHDRVTICQLNRTSAPKELPVAPPLVIQNQQRVEYEMNLYKCRFNPNLLPEVEQQYWDRHMAQPIRAVDDSFRLFNFDCMFLQYTSEWAVPRDDATRALAQVKNLISKARYPIHFPIEVRVVKHDDIWLSPCYQRDTCYIGVVIYKPFNAPVPYRNLLEDYEQVMRAHNGRPHWAKYHCMTYEDLAATYPKLDSFMRVRLSMDPDNLFMNDYLKRHLLPGGKPKYPVESDLAYQLADHPIKSQL